MSEIALKDTSHSRFRPVNRASSDHHQKYPIEFLRKQEMDKLEIKVKA